MDTGSDGQGLSLASATLRPCDFGRDIQGPPPQPFFAHLQSEGDNAQPPHQAILWSINVFLHIEAL